MPPDGRFVYRRNARALGQPWRRRHPDVLRDRPKSQLIKTAAMVSRALAHLGVFCAVGAVPAFIWVGMGIIGIPVFSLCGHGAWAMAAAACVLGKHSQGFI